MPAEIITVADAVVVALNAATLSLEFVAIRSYRPVFTLEELATLRISVVPRTHTATRANRNADRMVYEIEVGTQQRLEVEPTNDDLDPLMFFVQEMIDLFRGKPLAGMPAIACSGFVLDPLVSQEHLETLLQFTSTLLLTFESWR